jgi:hypothetical protein
VVLNLLARFAVAVGDERLEIIIFSSAPSLGELIKGDHCPSN